MLIHLIPAIIKEFDEKVKGITAQLYDYLIKGKLYRFEEELYKAIKELYKQLAFVLIAEAAKSKELEDKARIIGQKKGLSELRKEEVSLQLRTGDTIWIFSWFAVNSKSKRKKKRGPNGSGCHLLLYYWGCIKKASPSYYSLVTELCVLCPSFEIVVRVLSDQHVDAAYKRIRDIAYAVGNKCLANRKAVSLKPGESLAEKRVIISVDGGRTRIREEKPQKKKGKKNQGKRTPFDTPWREPKLFVIHVLDDEGKTSKKELPVYDLVLGKERADELFEILSGYLKELQIEKAAEVFVIADGARWIWERVAKTLAALGVKKEKITEAVDFYHAVEHLSTIVNLIHPHYSSKKRAKLLTSLKRSLKKGKIHRIISRVKALAKGFSRTNRQKIVDELKYFQKHEDRMQYSKFRKQKLPCGSGIVESAIRRIVNLRYKSPSTFWKEKNVEKLIFLRGLFLANRWKYAMNFLASRNLHESDHSLGIAA